MTSAPSLTVFRRRLKTVLFRRSYRKTCYLNLFFPAIVVIANSDICNIYTTLKNSNDDDDDDDDFVEFLQAIHCTT